MNLSSENLAILITTVDFLLVVVMLWVSNKHEDKCWEVLFHELSDLRLLIRNTPEVKRCLSELDAEDRRQLEETLDECIDIADSKIDDHYYNQNGIEAWDIINQVLEFHEDNITNREAGLLYNIMKYLLRYPYKGQSESDLEKVKVYLAELADCAK